MITPTNSQNSNKIKKCRGITISVSDRVVTNDDMVIKKEKIRWEFEIE